MSKEKEKCPNCDIELETASNEDTTSGDVYLSTRVEYCPKCLYVGDSYVHVSR